MTKPFLTRAADGLDRRGFTNADIARMIEFGVIDPDERFELILGEIVPMAAELNTHLRARARLIKAFARGTGDDVIVISEGSLFLAERLEFKPDLHVFPAHLRSEDVRGPDVLLAVELSSSTQAKDRDVKAPLYLQHGVRELWVLDLEAGAGALYRDGGVSEVDLETPLAARALPEVTVTLAELLR